MKPPFYNIGEKVWIASDTRKNARYRKSRYGLEAVVVDRFYSKMVNGWIYKIRFTPIGCKRAYTDTYAEWNLA